MGFRPGLRAALNSWYGVGNIPRTLGAYTECRPRVARKAPHGRLSASCFLSLGGLWALGKNWFWKPTIWDSFQLFWVKSQSRSRPKHNLILVSIFHTAKQNGQWQISPNRNVLYRGFGILCAPGSKCVRNLGLACRCFWLACKCFPSFSLWQKLKTLSWNFPSLSWLKIALACVWLGARHSFAHPFG